MPKRSLSSAHTKLWWSSLCRTLMTKDRIGSRLASGLPRMCRLGHLSRLRRSLASSKYASSFRMMASSPTRLLTLKTAPQRMASTMFGVPPSSRTSSFSWYACMASDVKMTVPPPGRSGGSCAALPCLGMLLRTSSTPGVPGPPKNLCGDRKIASAPESCTSIGTYGPEDAKSKQASASNSWSSAATALVAVRVPSMLEAALKDPMICGRSLTLSSSSRRCARSTPVLPSGSARQTRTSALLSRQGSRFEWCSNTLTSTAGRLDASSAFS
mmetsp:Transcript_9453/g.35397  ORF Transcript_9453/g.35397 Transcript_9453/m.35397 type:complete len:270 (-) Transcript_9453:769-1578(-)